MSQYPDVQLCVLVLSKGTGLCIPLPCACCLVYSSITMSFQVQSSVIFFFFM